MEGPGAWARLRPFPPLVEPAPVDHPHRLWSPPRQATPTACGLASQSTRTKNPDATPRTPTAAQPPVPQCPPGFLTRPARQPRRDAANPHRGMPVLRAPRSFDPARKKFRRKGEHLPQPIPAVPNPPSPLPGRPQGTIPLPTSAARQGITLLPTLAARQGTRTAPPGRPAGHPHHIPPRPANTHPR